MAYFLLFNFGSWLSCFLVNSRIALNIICSFTPYSSKNFDISGTILSFFSYRLFSKLENFAKIGNLTSVATP